MHLLTNAFSHGKTSQEDRLELSPDELVELAKSDKDDEFFNEVLKLSHIPNRVVPEGGEERWDDLVEFDRSTFDDAAYRRYQENFFKK